MRNNKILAGMTLIEMIMAIAIFTIGIGGLTLLFSKTWKANSYTLEMGQSTMAISQSMKKTVDYIRRARQGDDGSYPIQSADDNEFVFFCDYNKDGTTEKLHFYKSGQNILMGVTNPTAVVPKSYPSGDQTIITIATNIVNESDEPIFFFYNNNYPADNVNNPVETPALPADIRLVKIMLEVNTVPGRDPDNISLQSFVEMRNLNDYNQFK